MSISLSEALRQVQLEPGRVYQCQIGNLMIEVRVEQGEAGLLPAPLAESDVMLDPWTDLPTPETVNVLQAVSGGLILPDALDVFTDEQNP